ncbi:hypothetical protein DRP04_11520 [Archaeoglobales archaeon]|nr:MAG: hypothetical protein DRP04_11520 [Archaeoglobales archaeon]
MQLLDYLTKLYENEIKEYIDNLYEARDAAEDDLKSDALTLEAKAVALESLKEIQQNILDITDPTLPDYIIDCIKVGCAWEGYVKNVKPPTVVDFEGWKIVINYNLLTDWLIKRFAIVSHAKSIYIWNGKQYVENKGEVEKTIEQILRDQGVSDKRKIRDTVAEILMRILWKTFFREFPFNHFASKLIPVRNGILIRDSVYKLIPHSPAFGFTYCLPVDYNPKADCPHIKKFISEIVAEENQQILYEIPAVALLQNPWYQVAYMLVGDGSNGKSTYLKLLEHFLGRENISNVSLQELCEDRFKPAQLVGKLANIYADLPRNPIRYTGRFKVLTGGDRITIERKYKDPFEFENRAVLIFSANQLPEVNDFTYAFWRRWIVIEFPNKFPKNPDLIKELTKPEELSGFLNEVLKAMTRIEVKGEVMRTDAVEKMMETWMRKANSVYAFVNNCLEKSANDFEKKDDVYNAYTRFCELEGLTALPKNKFGLELQRFINVKSGQARIAGERVTIWRGIRLKCKDCKKCEEEEIEEGKTLEDYGDSWDLNELLS